VMLVFIYYLIFVLGEAMCLKRELNPLVGIWVANVVFLVLGAIMYRIVILERSSYRWLLILLRSARAVPGALPGREGRS